MSFVPKITTLTYNPQEEETPTIPLIVFAEGDYQKLLPNGQMSLSFRILKKVV